MGYGLAKGEKGRPTGLNVGRVSIEGPEVERGLEKQAKRPRIRQLDQEVVQGKEVKTKGPRSRSRVQEAQRKWPREKKASGGSER